MKSLKTTLLILSVALLSSCAGITDNQIDEEEIYTGSESNQIIQQDNNGFFNSGDQEDVIDVRPRDRSRDRP